MLTCTSVLNWKRTQTCKQLQWQLLQCSPGIERIRTLNHSIYQPSRLRTIRTMTAKYCLISFFSTSRKQKWLFWIFRDRAVQALKSNQVNFSMFFLDMKQVFLLVLRNWNKSWTYFDLRNTSWPPWSEWRRDFLPFTHAGIALLQFLFIFQILWVIWSLPSLLLPSLPRAAP